MPLESPSRFASIHPDFTMQQDEILSQIEDLKTDKQQLDKTLEKYDLDGLLESEFNAIDKAFKQLEIDYQSLKNVRKYLNNG